MCFFFPRSSTKHTRAEQEDIKDASGVGEERSGAGEGDVPEEGRGVSDEARYGPGYKPKPRTYKEILTAMDTLESKVDAFHKGWESMESPCYHADVFKDRCVKCGRVVQ